MKWRTRVRIEVEYRSYLWRELLYERLREAELGTMTWRVRR